MRRLLATSTSCTVQISLKNMTSQVYKQLRLHCATDQDLLETNPRYFAQRVLRFTSSPGLFCTYCFCLVALCLYCILSPPPPPPLPGKPARVVYLRLCSYQYVSIECSSVSSTYGFLLLSFGASCLVPRKSG